MGIRGISGEGKDSGRNGVVKRNSRSKEGFGSLKGRIHDRSPVERRWSRTSIS
jgi:hypothetical protein